MFNFYKRLHPFMDADTGANGGSAAASQDTNTTNVDTNMDSGTDQNGGATDSNTNTDSASQNMVQTPEQRAFHAEARRRAETAEKKAQEAEAARQRDVGIAKKYGAEYGVFSEADIAEKFGQTHGIKTLEEFEGALQRQEARNKGLDPDLLNQFISNHPAVKKAIELTEQQERQVAENALKTELGELNKEYPDLKLESIGDLSKLPNADKIFTLAKRGYSLLDAYESTNKSEIRKQQAEAARQATLNSVSGKGHLKGNGQGSEIDTTTIPDDVLEMYKKFNPGKTLDEYKKHYKQSLS